VLLRRTASGSDVRKIVASIEARISEQPKPICSRSCDFRIGDQLVVQSFRRTDTVSTDHAFDWRVKWMGAAQRRRQAGLHRRCDEISGVWLFALILIRAHKFFPRLQPYTVDQTATPR
jgi:hypothetical protein